MPPIRNGLFSGASGLKPWFTNQDKLGTSTFFPHFRHSVYTRAFSFLRCRFLYFFTDDLWVFQFLSTSTHLLRLVSFFSTMAYSMAHLAAGSLCLLEPSGYARAGSGVTTSVSALVLVLGFLSAPRTLNGVAMVDRPHYHPHAPFLLTANLVFFFLSRSTRRI